MPAGTVSKAVLQLAKRTGSSVDNVTRALDDVGEEGISKVSNDPESFGSFLRRHKGFTLAGGSAGAAAGGLGVYNLASDFNDTQQAQAAAAVSGNNNDAVQAFLEADGLSGDEKKRLINEFLANGGNTNDEENENDGPNVTSALMDDPVLVIGGLVVLVVAVNAFSGASAGAIGDALTGGN